MNYLFRKILHWLLIWINISIGYKIWNKGEEPKIYR